MTYPTPDLVVSGVPLPVREVDGREPRSLDDFVDGTTFVVEDRSGSRAVAGEGLRVGEAVRFHEKASGSGKDVRTWTVRADGEAFTAEPG